MESHLWAFTASNPQPDNPRELSEDLGLCLFRCCDSIANESPPELTAVIVKVCYASGQRQPEKNLPSR